MPTYKPVWSTLDDAAERAACVVSTVDGLERNQMGRRERALRNVQIYEGRRLDGLYPSAYFNSYELSGDAYDVVRLNLARSLVHTAIAKIAGKQKPKAQFCVSDADWSLKRRAKRREKFVEAVMMQRQGGQHDGWAVGVQAFRDCAVTDSGWLKFTPDVVAKRVNIERAFPWEILVDPSEARLGQPANLFHVYAYDRQKLAANPAFKKFKDTILTAPSYDEDSRATLTEGSDFAGPGFEAGRMVKVRECWRLPLSEDEPGRHCIVVGNVDLTQQKNGEAEEYTLPFFPFEHLVWEEWMVGMFGQSIVDCVANIHDELNAAMQRWSEAERLCSNGVTFYEEGSVKEEDLQDNRVGVAIAVRAGTQIPPTFSAPTTIGQSSLQWIDSLKSNGYEMPGISQMAATGQTDQGVTAAVAMRTQENVASERFSVQWQNFERMMAVGAARQILACARVIAQENGGSFKVRRSLDGGLEELDLADVDIDDDECEIQVYAVSGLVNTPADRLQLGSELYDRGILSQDGFLRVIQSKDIDGELDRANRQSAMIDRYIESWLDATPAKEKAGTFRYRPPIPFMNHQEAIVQVGRAYMGAEMDGAPDYNLGFFLRFMTECDKKLQEQQERAARTQAMAAGKQLPAGPPSGDMPNGAMVQ